LSLIFEVSIADREHKRREDRGLGRGYRLDMTATLITGANRGLGFEVARQSLGGRLLVQP
jgi:hypothetical protein